MPKKGLQDRRHPRPRRLAADRLAHREERRAELLEGALAAIRRHGPGVSMTQIAAAAGVTKPILYRHVGGREEIVAALTERFVAELTQRLQGAIGDGAGDPRELLATGVDAYLELIERETDLYRFLLRHAGEVPGGAEVLSRVIRQIGQTTVGTIGERLRSAGGDSGAAEPWGYGIVGMVHAAGDWWLEHRTMPRERLVAYLVSLAWDGMAGAVRQEQSPPHPPPQSQ